MTYRLCTAIALSGIAVTACGNPATNDPTAPPSETGAGLQDRGLAGASNTWVAKAKMPAARRYAAAASVGNVIYVIGGTTGNGTFTTNLQAYNVTTNTWSIKKPLPIPRAQGNGASVINGKIYVTGSYFDNSLFVYDPFNNTWTRKVHLPKDAFYGAQGVINGKLYVYSGGTTGFYRYNPSTNTWATLPKPISVHGFPAAGVIGGKFYLAGGGDDFGPFPDLEVYDPASNQWTFKAPMRAAVTGSASAVIDGKLYAAGGMDNRGLRVATVQVYDPSANAWATRAPLPLARAHAAGAVANGSFFVLGGQTDFSDASPRVESFTP